MKFVFTIATLLTVASTLTAQETTVVGELFDATDRSTATD
jgi:hypothetical protein